ncbi:nitrate reductase [Marinomonas agarivorans]|nr:nitrate reductase [Marinomonas agarivorans]
MDNADKAVQNTKTTCPYCGVGCGVVLPLAAEGTHLTGPVIGDKCHPANYGRLCVKGSHLADTLTPEGRLLQPIVDGQETSWQDATQTIADRIKRIVSEHGPDAFAFYLSGQILTEDYYVANKLAKGFIGTANVDTNSRLCMASAVVGYKRAFGSDTVPCNYEDLECCDLLIMVGSNAAWTHPVLYQRIQAAKIARPHMKIVVIDPRKTATCDIADLHLAIAPGSDAAIFSYLLVETARRQQLNQDYIDTHTEGFADTFSQAQVFTGNAEFVAQFCQISTLQLQQLADWWCDTEKTITFYSQGVNQSTTGVDKSNAIINCHLATGRIGREGMGPFSITGQPNAMGGREVGGLANQLAAHMDFATSGAIDLVQRFWQAPNMAQENGLKAVDLFQAIEAGKVKVVWIMSTNPMVSLPDTQQIQRALEQCGLVIVSDCQANTDTSRFADILLPATGWSEKNGTVTNSERRISRQRGLLPPAGNARHDWQAICDVAKKMGYHHAFDYQSVHEIFAEHAALSGFENKGKRDFDISYFADIQQTDYDALVPIQWPVTKERPQGTARMFSDGHFFTPTGKARFIPIAPQLPIVKANADFPYLLNTGRVRDQWHTMTRTGKAAKLLDHTSQPYLELCSQDATQLNVREGQLVRVNSELGQVVLPVKISENQRQGQVFIPIHWTSQFASAAVVSSLIPQIVDPLSGQPESKNARVSIEKIANLTYGFALTKQAIIPEEWLYWCRTPIDQGGQGNEGNKNSHSYDFAICMSETTPSALVKTHLNQTHCLSEESEKSEWIEYKNPVNGHHRIAYLHEGKLNAIWYFSPNPDLPAKNWLASLMATNNVLTPADRLALLMGRASATVDKGATICSCFNVGEKQIRSAIANGYNTATALGQQLKCGTNCGSCLPEIGNLLSQTQAKSQTETMKMQDAV